MEMETHNIRADRHLSNLLVLASVVLGESQSRVE